MMAERLTSVPCTICGKPVRLGECMVTELGQPVHETCVAERMTKEVQPHTKVARERES